VLTAGAAGAVRRATDEDLSQLAEALGRAFEEDPGFVHLLPERSGRARRLRLFFETELRTIAIPHRLAWTTEGAVGGAIWLPPGAWRMPVTAVLRELGPMIRVFGGRLPLALRARLRMERRHPRRPAHSYLAVIGVAPEWQGRGLGAALMRPGLEALDSEGSPAYLEASTPRSRELYRRHGFEATGEFHLPSGGPPVWQMWRQPG
jgi:GNAT superfamily N-acetyltransferase